MLTVHKYWAPSITNYSPEQLGPPALCIYAYVSYVCSYINTWIHAYRCGWMTAYVLTVELQKFNLQHHFFSSVTAQFQVKVFTVNGRGTNYRRQYMASLLLSLKFYADYKLHSNNNVKPDTCFSISETLKYKKLVDFCQSETEYNGLWYVSLSLYALD